MAGGGGEMQKKKGEESMEDADIRRSRFDTFPCFIYCLFFFALINLSWNQKESFFIRKRNRF